MTTLHYAYKNLNIVRRFYKVVENEIEREMARALEENNDPVRFMIPFMKDFNKQTPLHLCINNENYKSADIIL
jgi:hypothetical protein